MRWPSTFCGILALASLAGCGRQCEQTAFRDNDAFNNDPPPGRVIVMAPRDDRPPSLLLGGDGVDTLAVNIGRSDWPSAYRDTHEGDSANYREVFNDVQGGAAFGGFGTLWGNNYVWRQFRSERVGTSSR